MEHEFAMTFDYLCPFARNASEGVVRGLREGREWKPRFVPFSLSQVHVAEGDAPVWDESRASNLQSGVLALNWGIAVRDRYPDAFPDFHVGAFAARHDEALDINDENVLAKVAVGAGLDPSEISDVVAEGGPMSKLAEEHQQSVSQWSVFGVPTFIIGDEAVFVRLMERGRPDDVGRVLDMLAWNRLNEFKRTVVPR